MLISKKNLANFNNFFNTLDEKTANKIFNAIGIEIEQIIKPKAPAGLIVGKILSVQKVSGSDHLNLCSVQTMQGELQIICGANNVTVDKFVVVAPIGTKFSDEFIIKERKILNHVSQGMLCGYAEINPEFAKYLPKSETDGIILLDDDVNFTTNLYDYLGLDDEIYDLSLPSNRNDLNSIIALLNELNYQIDYKFELFNSKIKPKIVHPETINLQTNLIKNHIIGSFEVPNGYNTPWSIKKILINAKINVQNTVADYANYITLLTATPMHFYDADKVGHSLTFKLTDQVEEFITLNEEKISLAKNTLVSVDANNQIACAIGVIGANYSKVTNTTKKVIFEILNLDDDYMRECVEKNKIVNNSTTLFSKPLASIFLNYAFLFLTNWLSKKSISVHSYNNQITTKKMRFNFDEIRSVLGINLTNNEIKKILAKTGFKIFNNSLTIPSSRLDIQNINDVAEEVLKAFDINTISPEPILAKTNLNYETINNEFIVLSKLRERLISLGLYDFKTMNLVSDAYINQFNYQGLKPFEITNPISANRQNYRTAIIPSLLETLAYNLNKKQPKFNCFEIQKIYSLNKTVNTLAILLTKPISNDVFNQSTSYLEKDVKIVLDMLANFFNTKFSFTNFKTDEYSIISNQIYWKNEVIGYFGNLKKSLLKTYGINEEMVFAINLELDKILDKHLENHFIYQPVSALNPIYRELTFLNPDDTNLNNYFDHLRKFKFIEGVELIKIYHDKTAKSYTIRISIQANTNLSNKEIETIFNKCIEDLKKFELNLKF